MTATTAALFQPRQPREPDVDAWIERCAARLQCRTPMDHEQAVEHAGALWQRCGGAGCPERAAEAYTARALA